MQQLIIVCSVFIVKICVNDYYFRLKVRTRKYQSEQLAAIFAH